jgi:transposase
MVCLHAFQMLPFNRIVELVQALYGQTISEDTIANAVSEVAQAVEPSLQAIESALIGAAVAHADETGMRVAGKLNWLHVPLTLYRLHAKRCTI